MKTLATQLSECVRIAPALTDSGAITATFFFTPSFVGFDGHFPQKPILPGIVQIKAAAYTASRGSHCMVRTIKRCKFTHPIAPDELMHVSVHIEQKDFMQQASAVLTVNGHPCSTISFTLAQPVPTTSNLYFL